jgi:DNA invertase Pin-like site-specific DNA recombinase
VFDVDARLKTEGEKEKYRQRAMARGVRFGRKPKLTRHQREEAIPRKRNGETLTEIAKNYNVSHMTISRLSDAQHA